MQLGILARSRSNFHAKRETTLNHFIHLSRRDLLASPLFHLPTELILKISCTQSNSMISSGRPPQQPVIKSEGYYHLPPGYGALPTSPRSILPSCPLNNAVFDPPHTSRNGFQVASGAGVMRETLWEGLGSRTLNNPRVFVSQDPEKKFDNRIFDLLRRNQIYRVWKYHPRRGWELEWPPVTSTHRFSQVQTSWCSSLYIS